MKKPKVEVLTIGSGPPTIGVVYLQHGDEQTPASVVLEMIRRSTEFEPDGSIRLIGPINQDGFRREIQDGQGQLVDLNRQYPGKREGDLAEQTATKVFELCLGCDLVIDLHSFVGQRTVSTAYFLEEGRPNVQRKSLMGAKLLDTSMVKTMTDPEEGVLISELANREVASLIVELTPIEFMSPLETRCLAKRLLELPRNLGEFDLAEKVSAQTFESIEKGYAQPNSVFIPNPDIRLGSTVRKDTTLGKLHFLDATETKKVVTTKTGVLQALAPRRFCLDKEELFIMCKEKQIAV